MGAGTGLAPSGLEEGKVPTAKRNKTRKMFRATESFAYDDGAQGTSVHKGALFAEDSDAYVGHEAYFEETEYVVPDIEQATAGPGEER